MINIELLYSFVLCLVFAIANFFKVGLQKKTYVLPSTFFALMWGLTSLGGFLYSNLLIGDTNYYLRADYLGEISSYQFNILIVVFAAFLLARFKRRKVKVEVMEEFGSIAVSSIRHKMRWVLYLFFAIGIYRLTSILSVTGLDYSAMRSYYISSRSHFNEFELNVIRIGNYLSQFASFYISILGMETALRGVRLRQLTKEFLLFIPFHMSFGGRLFILTFFAPFIFSYLLTYSIAVIRDKRKTIDKKFLLVLISPLIMLVIVQILKMDEIVNIKTIEAYSTEVFYTSTAYIHMNELWNSLPDEYSLGYGLNSLGIGSSVYNHILESWSVERNPALVCVPSIIPQVFLDFGKSGSLVLLFVVFYYIEERSINCLKKLTTKNMLFIILLCQITYQTVSSSAYDCLRAFVVGYISLILFLQLTQLKITKKPVSY